MFYCSGFPIRFLSAFQSNYFILLRLQISAQRAIKEFILFSEICQVGDPVLFATSIVTAR